MIKTLYININGEEIQNTEDLIVVGGLQTSLIDKFYYELGKEILRGVPGSSGVKRKGIVLEFREANESAFNKILEQWNTLKTRLLDDNPTGDFEVELPMEYVSWLSNHTNQEYTKVASSIRGRADKVTISIDALYRNSIGLLINSIDPDECLDCEQFVVNDELITKDSRIVIDIKDCIGHCIPFVPFKDWHEANQDELNAESEEPGNDTEPNEAQVFFIAINNGQDPYKIRKFSVISLKNELYSHESTHGYLSYSLGVDDYNPYIDVFDVLDNFSERIWLRDGSIVEGSNLSLNENDIDSLFRIDHNRIEEEIRLFLESHPEYNDDENNIIVPDYDETYLPRYENLIWGFRNSGEDVIDFWELQISNNFKFEFLFKLKTRASWCWVKVLPSGLIAIRRIIDESSNSAWGIVDRTGIYILPCNYDFTPSKEVSTCPFEEIQPRIIKKGYTHDNSHWECLNVDQREVYDKVYNDFFVKEVEDFEGSPVAQLFDKNSFNLLFCIDNCNSVFADLSNGWYLVHNYKTLNPILISKNSYFELSIHEKVYDNIEAHALINAHNLDYKPLFVSEDRIITCVPKSGSGIGLMSIGRIKIYSYNGDLIKEFEIKNNPLLIKQPYKFGKALCFKIHANGKSADLYYLDLDGNEHLIPYKGGRRIKNYAETEVFLVSEDAFVINNKEDFWGELRNLNGDVLFKNTSWILPFSGQYLAYYSSKPEKKYGIIDYKGNIMIEPEYDSFELVECSNGVYKHYSMDGNCKELTE